MADVIIDGKPALVAEPVITTLLRSDTKEDARYSISAAEETPFNGKVLYLSADRSDGKDGVGSHLSPLNASTPERIDTIMRGLYASRTPANLHFLPHPNIRMNCVNPHAPAGDQWYCYHGLRIRGSGKGRTVFKPAYNPADARIFFSTGNNLANFVGQGSIEDCTFDGEVTSVSSPPGGALAYRVAYSLLAGDFQSKNVELINLGGRGQEVFPIALYNGAAGLVAAQPCNYLIENCSSKNLYGSTGVGAVVNGPFDDTRAYQRALFVNNHFEDMYISWAQFNNIEIRSNYLRNGNASYSNINCDTGINRGVKIIGNHLVGAISGGVAVGSIVLGNWLADHLKVRIDEILIDGNTFEMFPNNQKLWAPGIALTGNAHNWNISNNFYKPAYHNTHFSKRGFVSNKGTGNAANPIYLDDGTTHVNANVSGSPSSDNTNCWGFGNSWNLTKPYNADPSLGGPPENATYPWARDPAGGPQLANSDGILFNNKWIDFTDPVDPSVPPAIFNPYGPNHGKTPLGMANKLMSALT